ncbi:hypothetical protein ACH5RR_021806 [Cinchona calisaya]|uniref:Uncharacterized protein n=1 Tax=Cinchona calisaya TaxID=153742 RepID=A0ABD2ZLB2_9GENT
MKRFNSNTEGPLAAVKRPSKPGCCGPEENLAATRSSRLKNLAATKEEMKVCEMVNIPPITELAEFSRLCPVRKMEKNVVTLCGVEDEPKVSKITV